MQDEAQLKARLAEHADTQTQIKALKDATRTWRKETFKPRTRELKAKRQRIQKRLKPLCAQVRNEYSTSRLQADFRAGLEEMYRSDDDDGGDAAASDQLPRSSVPEGLDMDVFCISANDFLKVQGIKPASDGPPATFTNAVDTNIPALSDFVSFFLIYFLFLRCVVSTLFSLFLF